MGKIWLEGQNKMGSAVRLATLIPDIMNIATLILCAVVVVKDPLLVMSEVTLYHIYVLDLSLIYLIKLYAFSF